MREGFQFIGIDLDAEYCEVATKRLEHELQGTTSDDAPKAVRKTKAEKKAAEPQEDVPSLFDL